MPTAMAVPPHTSIRSLISFLHHHLRALLAHPAALHAARCLALLAPTPGPRREPPDRDPASDGAAVLAALHDAVDAFPGGAADADGLASVEAALQAPALLPEDGETAGLDNRRVAACAYFYLALVRAAQGDAWQMAMHFLQAVVVSPATLAAGELAPRALWDGLFDEAVLARAGGASEEDAARRAARRYKDWLMYYKVVAAVPDGAAGPSAGSGVHNKETHGTSSNITEETPADKVKGPNLLERAKEEVEALMGAVHDKMEHHSSPRGKNEADKDSKDGSEVAVHKIKTHKNETHGTSNDISEDTPIEKVKGPNVFERAKEEIEAIVEAFHPKKGSDGK